jgi:hypothetical protein
MERILQPDITQGATLRGGEYGWSVSSFPNALARAEVHGYACLGGQFQFRLDDGTCEMYWLSADPKERAQAESWTDYSHRSCSEVLHRFEELASATDFGKETSSWPSLKINPAEHLVFVAYFVTETELSELTEKLT